MKSIVHTNPRFKVIRKVTSTAEANEEVYYYISKPDAVVILVLIQDQLLFLKVKRLNQAGIGLELPGGRVEPNEEPIVAAQRELAEETGISTDRLIPFAETAPLPSVTDERVFAFWTELTSMPERLLEKSLDHEGIKGWQLVELSEIQNICRGEQIKCSIDGYFSLLMAVTKCKSGVTNNGCE